MCGYTYYILNSYSSESCVDFSGTDFVNVFGHPLHRGPNQQWTVEDAGDSYVYLRNGKGTYLSLTSPTQGARTVGTSYPNDKWALYREGSYTMIIHTETGMVLDLANGSSDACNPITLELVTDVAWQRWFFHGVD